MFRTNVSTTSMQCLSRLSERIELKIGYLVFAYNNPRLLQKTVCALSSCDCCFVIHIDKKSNLDEFAPIAGDNIAFTKRRIPVFWAEFSGIQAILLLLQEALALAPDCDYYTLLSGSEYPLRSKEYVHSFLETNRSCEFISLVRIPNERAGKPLARINTFAVPSSNPIGRFAMRVCNKVGLAQRDCRTYLGDLEPYGGHTWWTLSKEACQYVLEFVNRSQRLVEFFQNVVAPEEMFFHTILGNSPFRSRIRRNLVYEDWSSRAAHPCPIEQRHIAMFDSQQKVVLDDVYGTGEVLFARKFSDKSLGLLQTMDDMIRRKERKN